MPAWNARLIVAMTISPLPFWAVACEPPLGIDEGSSSGEYHADDASGTNDHISTTSDESSATSHEASETSHDGTDATTPDGICGDARIDVGEECDGTELAGASCDSLGFTSGWLSCSTDCTFVTDACGPGTPVLQLVASPIKRFTLSWEPVIGADMYRIDESPFPGDPFERLADDFQGTSISLTVPLALRQRATYRLWACNDLGCSYSALLQPSTSLAEAVGYIKASHKQRQNFGRSVTLSPDGNTLVVGAPLEGDNDSGAAYVFVREASGWWTEQAYLKGSNPVPSSNFGYSTALDEDGNTLAVGAYHDRTGGHWAGAFYVFVRDDAGTWSQQIYIPAVRGPTSSLCVDTRLGAEDTCVDAEFGSGVALSGSGDTLFVGARGFGSIHWFERDDEGRWLAYLSMVGSDSHFYGEDMALSNDGNTLAVGSPTRDPDLYPGDVTVYVRNDRNGWSHQGTLASSTGATNDGFGRDVALSGDGNVVAVGAPEADGDGNSRSAAGAAYVFVRTETQWSQFAHLTASHPHADDAFGDAVALNGDGSMLAVGASREDGATHGLGGDPLDLGATDSDHGAAYLFLRDAMGHWAPQAYVKASNQSLSFGDSLSLDRTGDTLAVGAPLESVASSVIDGNQTNYSNPGFGAVYLY